MKIQAITDLVQKKTDQMRDAIACKIFCRGDSAGFNGAF
jgi:hypothetical protein